jgi:hypothetical protein
MHVAEPANVLTRVFEGGTSQEVWQLRDHDNPGQRIRIEILCLSSQTLSLPIVWVTKHQISQDKAELKVLSGKPGNPIDRFIAHRDICRPYLRKS